MTQSETNTPNMEAWFAGRMMMDDVAAEELAAVPVRRIVEAYVANRSLYFSAKRLLEVHPELRDGATALAVLEMVWSTADMQLVNRLLDRLGELKHAPAIPLLTKALLGDDKRFHTSAAQALIAVGTPEALAPLVGLLDAPGGLANTDVRLPLAVEAVIRVDPRTSLDRLAPRFEPAALSTENGLQLARSLLFGDAKLLQKDARWLDFAVKLTTDTRLPARDLLLGYKLPAVVDALKRAGLDPASRPPRTHPIPANRRWLERYQAGEHEAVWDEIRALEDSVRDPAVLPEARAVADEMMKRVRANLERIGAVLKGKKYKLRKGAKALAAPDSKAGAALDQIEALLERPLPLSVRAFYAIVGEVSLLEKPDGGDGPWFEGYGAFEPLSPAPLKEVLSPLKEDAKEEKRYPAPLRRRPDRLYFSDDPAFKAQPDEAGNDRPIYLDLLGSDADAEVDVPRRAASDPREHVSFVELLRRYVRGGGFLWLPEEDTQRQREALTKGFLPF